MLKKKKEKKKKKEGKKKKKKKKKKEGIVIGVLQNRACFKKTHIWQAFLMMFSSFQAANFQLFSINTVYFFNLFFFNLLLVTESKSVIVSVY